MRPHRRRHVAVLAVATALVALLAVTSPAAAQASSPSSISGSYRELWSVEGPGNNYQFLLDPLNGELYLPAGAAACLSCNASVDVVSIAFNSVVATPVAGHDPVYATLDPDSGNIYVSDLSLGCICGSEYTAPESNVTVISGSTNQAIASISLGQNASLNPDNPYDSAFDPENGDLYVLDEDVSGSGGAISVIATGNNSVIATIPLGASPSTALYDPADGDIYVAGGAPAVEVISGQNQSLIGSISPPGGSWGERAVFDPATGDVYVPGLNGSLLVANSSDRVLQTLPYSDGASPLGDGDFIDSAGNIWALQAGDPANLTEISPVSNDAISSFSIGSAEEMAYDPATDVIFSDTNSLDSVVNITSLATGEHLQTLDLGLGPIVSAFVYDPDNQEVYVLGQNGAELYAIGYENSTASSSSTAVAPVEYLSAGAGVGVLVGAAAMFVVLRRRGRGDDTRPT